MVALLALPALLALTFHWYPGAVPPLTGVAVNVTVAPGQQGFADAAMLTLAGRLLLTAIVIALEMAGLPVAQVSEDVRMQDTRSPDTGLYEKVALLALPALLALTFHWYPGEEPPLTGVAVNVTELPRQNGLAEETMLMLTGRTGRTDTGYGMQDAGFPEAQVSEEVRMQDTRSPDAGV